MQLLDLKLQNAYLNIISGTPEIVHDRSQGPFPPPTSYVTSGQVFSFIFQTLTEHLSCHRPHPRHQGNKDDPDVVFALKELIVQ